MAPEKKKRAKKSRKDQWRDALGGEPPEQPKKNRIGEGLGEGTLVPEEAVQAVNGKHEPPFKARKEKPATPRTEQASDQTPNDREHRRRAELASQIGGKEMAENSNKSVFEDLRGLRKEVFSVEGAKKFAGWYIDTNERIAKGVIDIQASLTGWAKDTPLAPIFEAQQEFGRRVVERSADAARQLWRIKESDLEA